jgi:hypothetical protein
MKPVIAALVAGLSLFAHGAIAETTVIRAGALFDGTSEWL